MVLEMEAPAGSDLSDLLPVLPALLSYILSFIYLGIYWNNHHHMMHVVQRVKGSILWANLHLLFWLSLIPFVTSWMGENHFTSWPVALYGVVLLMAALAWYILSRLLIQFHGSDSRLAAAYSNLTKEKISPVIYLTAIILAFWMPKVSLFLYLFVAILWVVPDRRIERELMKQK